MLTERILAATGALGVLFGMGWIDASNAAEAVPRRVLLSEGFEGEGQIQFWTGNGSYKVNFAGPTDEKAASGKRSFKIDIAFQKGSHYNYWQSIPLMIPCYGQPEASGKLYVEPGGRGDVRLGFCWTGPGDRAVGECSGLVSAGTKVRSLPSGWTEWSS